MQTALPRQGRPRGAHGRTRAASPAAGSAPRRSAPGARPRPSSVSTNDVSTRRRSSASTPADGQSIGGAPPRGPRRTTASAASSVKAPANTESHTNRRLLGRGEQVVAPVHQRPQRLLAAQGGAAAAGQQPEAVVQPDGDLLDGQRPHPPPAANSRANGIPSRRRQISATAGGVPRGQREPRRDRRRRGRRRAAPRRRPAAPRPRGCHRRPGGPGTARGRPPRRRTPSGSRLVASRRRPGHPPRSACTTRALTSTTCSQLSRTSSSRRHRSASARAATGRPVGVERDARRWRPRPGGRAPDRRAGPAPPAGPRPETASAADKPRAISTARRVLPTPPGPVRVTSRCCSTRRRTSAPSRSRPTNDVGSWGRVSARPGPVAPPASPSAAARPRPRTPPVRRAGAPARPRARRPSRTGLLPAALQRADRLDAHPGQLVQRRLGHPPRPAVLPEQLAEARGCPELLSRSLSCSSSLRRSPPMGTPAGTVSIPVTPESPPLLG